jgi:hypothetical protein
LEKEEAEAKATEEAEREKEIESKEELEDVLLDENKVREGMKKVS